MWAMLFLKYGCARWRFVYSYKFKSCASAIYASVHEHISAEPTSNAKVLMLFLLCAPLQVLQDEVPHKDLATVQSLIEDAYGVPFHTVFEKFDTKPLGAASIGQVDATSYI